MAIESELIFKYTEVFNAEECKEIRKYIDNLEQNGVLCMGGQAPHVEDVSSFNASHFYHEDLETHMSSGSWLGGKILPRFVPCVKHYTKHFSTISSHTYFMHDVKVKKIYAGGGFHSWHHETGSVTTSQRHFVIQVYLNTVDEGGETEFLYQNKRFKPEEGTVLIFPAGYTHAHRGNPPIGQTKYIGTSWAWIQNPGFAYPRGK